MAKVDRSSNAGTLIQIAHIARKIGIIGKLSDITFKMSNINEIKTYQRDKQAPIGFSVARACQKFGFLHLRFEQIKLIKQRRYRFFTSRLGISKANILDAIIDRVINPFVQVVDLFAQILRIKISRCGINIVERNVKHSKNGRELIGNSGIGFFIPKHRHGHPTRIILLCIIKLIHVPCAVDSIWNRPVTQLECPAIFSHKQIFR